MKINLEVTTLDSVTTKVTAQFADFIAFETDKNRSVANFQTELRLTDLAWLAWHATKRTKKTAMKSAKCAVTFSLTPESSVISIASFILTS